MSLTDALHRYVQSSELRTETEQKLKHRLACWQRHGGDDTSSLRPAQFEAFRQAAMSAGLARRTIEETVSDVARIAGCDDVGRRLKGWKVSRCRDVPSVELLSIAYQLADSAEWPNGPNCRTPALMQASTSDWLRAFLVFAFFTGLRWRDLRTVTWDAVDRLEWEASKTSKLHQYPACEIVTRHLEPLRTSGSELVFPFTACHGYLLRRELKRISNSDKLTPQAIRRCSITQWSIASPDAGRLIHGTGIGIRGHYLDVRRVLASALPQLEWPLAFLSEGERDRRQQATTRILSLAGRLPADRLDDLERVAQAFAG